MIFRNYLIVIYNSCIFFLFAQNINQKGILRIDHSQTPDLLPGIYKMSVSGNTIKIDLQSHDKSLAAVLPVMPGPKGGVLILGSKYDSSKIVEAAPKVQSNPEKMAISRVESPVFRGIFPKNKNLEDSPTKISRPDFCSASKLANSYDVSKKLTNSSLRKVLGSTLSKGKGRMNISTSVGVPRLKSTLIKSECFT